MIDTVCMNVASDTGMLFLSALSFFVFLRFNPYLRPGLSGGPVFFRVPAVNLTIVFPYLDTRKGIHHRLFQIVFIRLHGMGLLPAYSLFVKEKMNF
jgi:hypothetical protein